MKDIMVEMRKRAYPVGVRVRLISMGDDPNPIPEGTEGTVTYVDDLGQVGVNWDNGRSLAMIPCEDIIATI